MEASPYGPFASWKVVKAHDADEQVDANRAPSTAKQAAAFG